MSQVWYQVVLGIQWAIRLAEGVLVAYFLLSFFLEPRTPVMKLLTRVTDPFLVPIRKMIFRSTHKLNGGLWAPVVAFALLELASAFLWGLVH